MTISNATEKTFKSLVLDSSLPVLVDFWAAWCGPCRSLAPLLKEVAQEHAGKLVVVKVNNETEHALFERYTIRSMPTLILVNGGKEVARKLGCGGKADLVAFIRKVVK